MRIPPPPDVFNGPFEALKKVIKSLKRKQLCDEHAISLISETIANVKDQVDYSRWLEIHPQWFKPTLQVKVKQG